MTNPIPSLRPQSLRNHPASKDEILTQLDNQKLAIETLFDNALVPLKTIEEAISKSQMYLTRHADQLDQSEEQAYREKFRTYRTYFNALGNSIFNGLGNSITREEVLFQLTLQIKNIQTQLHNPNTPFHEIDEAISRFLTYITFNAHKLNPQEEETYRTMFETFQASLIEKLESAKALEKSKAENGRSNPLTTLDILENLREKIENLEAAVSNNETGLSEKFIKTNEYFEWTIQRNIFESEDAKQHLIDLKNRLQSLEKRILTKIIPKVS